MEGLSALRPTPPHLLHPKKALGSLETTDTHPNVFLPAQGWEKSGGCSLLCLFIPVFFFSAFQETIIIQIIAVIYSAIRAAGCGGREPRQTSIAKEDEAGGSALPASVFVLLRSAPKACLQWGSGGAPPRGTQRQAQSLGKLCVHMCVLPGEGGGGPSWLSHPWCWAENGASACACLWWGYV